MSSAAAEEKNETENSSSGSAAPAPGGGNKLVLVFTLVNLVVTLGMIGVLFISFKKESNRPQVTDINANPATAAAKTEEGHGESKAEGKKEEGHGEGEAKEKKAPAEFGHMIALDQFTVNLTSPGSSAPRFVRVNVSLEVGSEDVEAEVNAKIPQVRNAVIDLFNSKRPSDLENAEGRDALKEEIKSAINGFLTRGRVKGVFFTNFVLGS
ncbi:MAG: flagellar basal body-associated FliL family protein [Oligoflexia bacterium]|nr:flagellar basal body-associated FliL family protein [Oligoflexia bacterium]